MYPLHKFMLSILVLLFLYLSSTLAKKSARLQYKEKCATYTYGQYAANNYSVLPKTLCNENSNLECIRSRCACNSKTVYNKIKKMCITPLAGECDSHSICPVNSTCQTNLEWRIEYKYNTPPYFYERLKKLDTKTLRYDTCRCAQDHETVNYDYDSCRPYLDIGEPCLRYYGAHKCNGNKGLTCSKTGKCTCVDNTWYNPSIKRCVNSIKSTNCRLDEYFTTCNENALCSSILSSQVVQQIYNTWGKFQRDYVHRDFGQCVCAPGYTENSEGNCSGGYQVRCSKTTDCNTDQFLACIDGICQCEKSTAQIFTSWSGVSATCNIKAGYPCVVKSGPKCVHNSICFHKKCLCADGSFEGDDGRCLLLHGENCTMPGDVNPNPCNHFRGLACIDTECACFDQTLKWNATTQRCIAAVEQSCGKIVIVRDTTLKKNQFYPFAISKSRSISYTVGCADGLSCVRHEIEYDKKICKSTNYNFSINKYSY